MMAVVVFMVFIMRSVMMAVMVFLVVMAALMVPATRVCFNGCDQAKGQNAHHQSSFFNQWTQLKHDMPSPVR